MSRRRRAEKREVLPDPKFGDKVISKFMSSLMLSGKKSTSEKVQFSKPSSVIIDEMLINRAEMKSLTSISKLNHQI